MEPSLQRRPRFDHPMITLGLVTATLSVLAAFITLRVVSPAEPTDRCAETLGRFRIEMKQSKVPSVFDTKAWDAVTDQYNDVFADCESDVAAAFAAEEFNPWAAPALNAMRPTAVAPETGTPDSAAPPTDAPTSTPPSTPATDTPADPSK